MNRPETTCFLLRLLQAKTEKPGIYGATEVSIDWGTKNVRYVDYMTFSPKNTVSTSGIEKGIFTCYEIKSCYEDLYSGHGLNFIGEKNYLVTTAETYRRMLKDTRDDIRTEHSEGKLSSHIRKTNPESKYRIGYDVGVMVAIPIGRTLEEEIENPTKIKSNPDSWTLKTILPCHETDRKRSLQEMLFHMLRASERKEKEL